jgi:3-methyladenine DNA glycosylase Mpg
MKESYAYIGMGNLCKWFSISRQAYYRHEWNQTEEVFQYGLVLEEVKTIRQRHPRLGVRKLQELLHPFMQEHSIKMGRDALFDFLSNRGLLVRKRKRHIKTTSVQLTIK